MNERNAPVHIPASPGALDSNVVDNRCDNVHVAIKQILEKNYSGLSFGELYGTVFNLVLQGQGARLYDDLQRILEEHLSGNVRDVLRSLESENFLASLISAWSDHQTAMGMIRDNLGYIDRVYVTKEKLDPIFNLGLQIFRDQLVRHDVIRDKMRNTILNQIQIERQGELINPTPVSQITNMLMTLGIDLDEYLQTKD